MQISSTKEEEMIDITEKVSSLISIDNGLCIVYCPHTTAGLTLGEGIDPAVNKDFLKALSHMIPNINYEHLEGNSPAHIKATLVGNTVTIPVEKKKLQLGTWQFIFLCEFDGPRNREVLVHCVKNH
jgi:secondary thiamine-phosphate synthase enzyme